MTESVKRINNPLTIIAIFAALAEINATVSLGLISESLQSIFIWFVLGFPTLLVLCFFFTLNFNPKVLYAPSDFKDEQNFLNTLTGNYKMHINVTKENVKEINNLLETEILDSTIGKQSVSAEILKFANEYFKGLLEDLEVKLENKILKSIGFGIQDQDLFLLSLKYNKSRFPENFAYNQDYIIKFLKDKNGIYAEIPRLNIKESNYKNLVKKTFEYIQETIDNNLDKRNDKLGLQVDRNET